MTQIAGTSHTLRALTELRKRILNGELRGGERLFEVAMAETIGISRTPVREAMARLAEEGLLERSNGGGFLVRIFTMDDVIDSIDLRGVLEGTAARMAAERGLRPGALNEMERIVERLDGCFGATPGDIDFEGYSRHNADFHRHLARLPGSTVMEREIARVMSLPFASPSAFLPDKMDVTVRRRSLELAQDQHREIVAAIAKREGARADFLAREHARTARRDLEFVLDSGKDVFRQMAQLALVVA